MARTCKSCDGDFDRHDLVPFLFVQPGNTLYCLYCQARNYLIATRNVGYWIFFIFAVSMGLLILGFTFQAIGFLGINLSRIGIITGIVATAIFIIGLIVAIWTSRFCLKLWNWRYGTLSLDHNKQSVLDFGH